MKYSAIILLIILNFSFISCVDEEEDYGGDKPVYSVLAEAEDVIILRYDEKQEIDLVIRGKKDFIYRDNFMEMHDFKVLFYGKDDKGNPLNVQLTANFGKVNTKTKDFEAWENVIVIKEK